MRKIRYNVGYFLLDIDDWFAERKIFFDWFVKDKENHVSLLSRIGFNLIFNNYE